MVFLDKRIQVICDELKKLSVRQKIALADWQVKPGLFMTPEEAGDEGFQPFDSGRDHWYGPDEHYWFRAEAAVPDSFDGRSLWLHVRTQIEEWDDGKNPQFLLFLNGKIVQGLDMNHRDVLIARQAKAGETYRIDLQAYTGTLHTEFSLIAEWQEIDPDINGLYWDLQVPLQAFSRLDPQSRSRMDLEKALNDTVNLLDLRTPYSDAYMDSVRAARAYVQKHVYEDLAGHDEVIATCIGHTHIDVAWWWTVAQTREKVVRSFATVLKLMEEYPSYKFMSSQPVLYYFLKQRYPDLYERIRERVAEGRWEVEGATWLEMDCNLTSGESLVRQFIHGKRFFREEFGVENRILWLPDVFGYSGALPQIMKQCGIQYFMTTKLAWNQFNKHPYDTFRWRGIDGTEILTHLITTLGVGQDVKNYFTTYNGMLHPDALMGGWERYQNKDINNDIPISYGYGDGGGGPTRAMLETSDRMEKGVTGLPRVRQAFARTYFDELKERVAGNPRLPVWEGELYFEYHRGTYTSMARNKRANRKTELRLMDTELLAALASDKMAYPAADLDKIWKNALLNQFHDILPGSSIHEVYEVTKQEYAAMEARLKELEGERLRALFPASDCVTVVNTKGFVSDETVNLGKVDGAALVDGQGGRYPIQQTEDGAVAFLPALPAKGWRTYALSREAGDDLCDNITCLNTDCARNSPFTLTGDRHLVTPYYDVTFDEHGLMANLTDRENGRQVLSAPGNLLRMYEDKPIYYDNWDIDIFYTEKSWDVTDVQSFRWTETGPVRVTLEIVRKISNSTISQKIHFYAHSRRIDFETTVDWREHQHLLKVHFPTTVHSDEATFEIQFGNLKRKVHTNTSWDVARFESCGQKWMDFSEGHYGVSLLNDCKYGHSVKDGCIALTLIKSGIEPNPMADQETHMFTYALYPHKEDWKAAGTVREAYRLNLPALAVQGGEAGKEYSLVSVNMPNIVLETVKRAEDGDGWIVRMYESENALTDACLTWNRPIASVEACNCLEEPGEKLAATGGQIPFTIKPYEIKTFRIREKE